MKVDPNPELSTPKPLQPNFKTLSLGNGNGKPISSLCTIQWAKVSININLNIFTYGKRSYLTFLKTSLEKTSKNIDNYI